jgi:DNA polymerase-3 subunit alpha
MDFTIEEAESSGKEAIRFGLAAVKNVGEGPVQVILAARQEGGAFEDIDDFCRRVDLRQVNRRALESLVKVGALDRFGQRALLSALIERMVRLSATSHQAQAVGQMSFFDSGAFDAPIGGSILYPLPEVEEVSQKEALGWEKELLGVYVSEHPLQRAMDALSDANVVLCGQISEDMVKQKVTVAGMVKYMRPIVTKKGDPMAFVQLEDLQGEVEVVVFPSVYQETQDSWRLDKILIVRGRVDAGGRGPKVICESVREHITQYRPVEQDRAAAPGQPHHLHITIPRTGDQERDIQRLGQVYDLLCSFEGRDDFSLYVADNDKRVQLDFPNISTGYCPALEQRLAEILGADAVRVD